VNQYDVAKLLASVYLRVAVPQNAVSGFHSSGISFTGYASFSITDRPDNDSTPASPTRPPLLELPQLCAYKVSLSNTSTSLGTVSVTHSDQSKSVPSTSCSPHYIQPCPAAQKSANIRWKRKCQQAEVVTSTPAKKQQREEFY
jgi:hypothetical protein